VLFSERSGVVNIGIEGMMTMGAFVGAAVSYFSGNPWLGLLAAGVAGGLIALLHAVASVTFNADQTISGIALNLIGPGFALFFCRLLFEDATMTPPVTTLPSLFGENAFAGTAAANLNVDVYGSAGTYHHHFGLVFPLQNQVGAADSLGWRTSGGGGYPRNQRYPHTLFLRSGFRCSCRVWRRFYDAGHYFTV
jgi:ABC-type uncharacterized transport system permease subunit